MPNRPSLFRPLVQVEKDLVSLNERVCELVIQARRFNSHDGRNLEEALIDLNALVLDAKDQLKTTQKFEKRFRKGE